MNSSKRSKTEDAAADADVLREYATLRDALAQTHVEIPKLLARERDLNHELGLSEARGDAGADDLRRQLVDIVHQRQAAVRRRAASIQGVLDLEASLQADRAAAEAERQRIAGGIIAEFSGRWKQACDALSTLRSEAEALARALRVSIATPAPYVPYTHIDGSLRVRLLTGSEVPVSLPANLSRIVERLDGLDAALVRVTSIQQSKQLDERHYQIALRRNQPTEFHDTYLVTAAFDCLSDGLPFQTGDLVDGSLLGGGQLGRLLTAQRYLRPANLAATAA
jgi:hypothetical protein